MRILLVQSESTPTGLNPVLPIGLCYLGTALANNHHDVNIYDVNTTSNPVSDLKRLIRKSEPEIIGVSLRNIDTTFYTHNLNFIQAFTDLVSIIKETAPETMILAGGPAFSIYGQQLMERLPDIEYGIFSEGEETLPDLLNNLNQPQSVKGIFLRNNNKILFTGAREPIDFASFSAPRRDFLDLEPYLKNSFSIGVQTKRGCPFNCVYCTYPYLQGNEVRMRPADAVLDEIEDLVRKYNLRSFSFVDSVFNVPQSYAREILKGMMARGLDIQWRGFDELKYFDEEYFKLAKASGCVDFEFSPDGMTRSTLAGLNKVTSPEDIERGYSIIKNNDGVRASFSFFINGPGESLANIFYLTLFIIRCRLFIRRKLNDIYVLPIRIYRNTPIYDLALEKGLIKPDDDILGSAYYDPPQYKYLLPIVYFILPRLTHVLRIIRSLFLVLLTTKKKKR
jgi:anaerobic magnesium-protoporphyrin IX monomethyl ester cyclase